MNFSKSKSFYITTIIGISVIFTPIIFTFGFFPFMLLTLLSLLFHNKLNTFINKKEEVISTKRRKIKGILILSIGFFMVFFALNTSADLLIKLLEGLTFSNSATPHYDYSSMQETPLGILSFPKLLTVLTISLLAFKYFGSKTGKILTSTSVIVLFLSSVILIGSTLFTSGEHLINQLGSSILPSAGISTLINFFICTFSSGYLLSIVQSSSSKGKLTRNFFNSILLFSIFPLSIFCGIIIVAQLNFQSANSYYVSGFDGILFGAESLIRNFKFIGTMFIISMITIIIRFTKGLVEIQKIVLRETFNVELKHVILFFGIPFVIFSIVVASEGSFGVLYVLNQIAILVGLSYLFVVNNLKFKNNVTNNDRVIHVYIPLFILITATLLLFI